MNYVTGKVSSCEVASFGFGHHFRTALKIIFPTLLILSASLIGACKVAATTEPDHRERNTKALAKAIENIETYRKGAAQVMIRDSRGNPVRDVKLQIRQVDHAFKFGCYLKIDDLDPAKLPDYEKRFKQVFNYAVIGTYWDFIESKRGVEDWSWFDRESELAGKLGIATAAAPVLWGTNRYGTPGWLPRTKNELLPILERRVRSSVARNALITEWEVVNEPLAPKPDVFAEAASDDYIGSAFRWARDSAPTKRLIINEYGVFGSLKSNNYNSEPYFQLLEKLLAKGIPIDVIGIQAHSNGEWFEPANVAEKLDKYATLGKAIQITEFSAQTHDQRSALPISGTFRSGVWGAEKQAEFYREFYTIAFGNPRVEAIVTWGLDEERAWLPGIGLIDRNGEPKPAFQELNRLINGKWKTCIDANTGEKGSYDLTGFFGDYEIVATTRSGKTTRSTFKLVNGAANEWLMRIEK